MSNRVQGWVWDHAKAKDISGNDLVVLLKMADIADDDGMCYPSYAHLADKSNISVRTAMRVVEKLERLELVIAFRYPTQGLGRNNKYVVRMDRSLLDIADHFELRAEDSSGARSTEDETCQPDTFITLIWGERSATVKGDKLSPLMCQSGTLKPAQRRAQVSPKPVEPLDINSNNNLDLMGAGENFAGESSEAWSDAERETKFAAMRDQLRGGQRVTPSEDSVSADRTDHAVAVGQ